VPGSPFTAGQGTFSVAVDPSGKFVYATNFDSNDISAYAVSPATGALAAVAGSPFTDGGPGRELPGPTGLAVLPSGKFACVAHYYSYDISVLAIDAATGALADITGSPFATAYSSYGLTVDPTGRFVYVADYGNDSVSAYAIDATTGALTIVAGSPFPTGAVGSLAWSIAVDPAGKFVYVVNRSADSVSGYAINSATGALTAISGSPFPVGPDPHAVAVDPTGKFAYVANFGSNNVTAFAINSSTGRLTAVGGSPFAAGPGPAHIAIIRIRQ
jgi:6-phosphogluconolactonase (cycloisomerase 2 family)